MQRYLELSGGIYLKFFLKLLTQRILNLIEIHEDGLFQYETFEENIKKGKTCPLKDKDSKKFDLRRLYNEHNENFNRCNPPRGLARNTY